MKDHKNPDITQQPEIDLDTNFRNDVDIPNADDLRRGEDFQYLSELEN